MSEIMIDFKIEYWDIDRNRWSIQSLGSDTLSGILKNWEGWLKHGTSTHYRLIFIVTQEVIIDEVG